MANFRVQSCNPSSIAMCTTYTVWCINSGGGAVRVKSPAAKANMTQAMKLRRNIAARSTKRREPSAADYSDEISEKTLAEIQRLAKSKDKADERWETVREPAW